MTPSLRTALAAIKDELLESGDIDPITALRLVKAVEVLLACVDKIKTDRIVFANGSTLPGVFTWASEEAQSAHASVESIFAKGGSGE